MGEWIKRKVDEHVCDYPRAKTGKDININDIWKCDCGKQWRVTGFDSGPQWDPYGYTAITWTPIDEQYNGIYAPGTK